jgi:hypothetical protein
LSANPNYYHFNGGEGTLFSVWERMLQNVKLQNKNKKIIWYHIRMAIATFNKKKTHFTNKLDLK